MTTSASSGAGEFIALAVDDDADDMAGFGKFEMEKNELGPARFLELESGGAGFLAIYEEGDFGSGSFLAESHCGNRGSESTT